MANGQGSAGVAIREYEVTGPVGTPPPLGIPAGVIGTALRGPAFVPVTVGSNAAFRLKFGGTDGKKFGPLAINEWMVNSGGRAATYLRVLGAGDCKQRNDDGTVTKAGFVVGSQLPDESGDLARNPHAEVTTVAATAASASIVVLSVPNPVGADDNEGFVFYNFQGKKATLKFSSSVADNTSGYTLTQTGTLGPTTADLVISVDARPEDTAAKAARIKDALAAAEAFGVTATVSGSVVTLKQTRTGILPPAYRSIEGIPGYGLPASISVTPFSAGTIGSESGVNGPGRTYFLGGMMKDYVSSDGVSLNYLMKSNLTQPALNWFSVGDSSDSEVWCRSRNPNSRSVLGTGTYSIKKNTVTYLTAATEQFAGITDLPTRKANNDVLVGIESTVLGINDTAFPVGTQATLRLDLGADETFTYGDPAAPISAGKGDLSEGGDKSVGNVSLTFTNSNVTVSVRHKKTVHVTDDNDTFTSLAEVLLGDDSRAQEIKDLNAPLSAVALDAVIGENTEVTIPAIYVTKEFSSVDLPGSGPNTVPVGFSSTGAVNRTVRMWINVTKWSAWIVSFKPASDPNKVHIDDALDAASLKSITNAILIPFDINAANGVYDETFISLNTVSSYESSYPVVRGVLMAPSGVLLDLKENNNFGDDAGLVDANQGFVLRLNGFSSGSASTFVSASFDPKSDSYFAKVLNTDPLKIQERGHYLYASWDVHPDLATVSGSCFILSGSEGHNSGSATVPNFENWEDRFSHPVTPWVVSQRFGASPKNLFRLHSLDDGEGAATSYKFSIENLVPGNPEIAGGFGTFDLLIRDWNDTDADPVILESFRGLTLDPRSDKYVARAIGNSYRRFDFDRIESEQKLVDEIDHPMGSNLVRVEMDYSYEEGNIEPSALPMGFRGVNHLNTRDTLSGDDTLIPHISTPPVPMRFNLVVGTGTRSRLNSDLFWGMQFENISGSAEPNSPPAGDLYRNRSLEAFTKFFPSHLTEIASVWKVWTKEGESDLDSFCNNGFSLEKIFVVENAGDTSTPRRADPSKWNFAKYARDGQQPTAPDSGTFRELNVNDLTLPKNRRHAKFTFVMQGGFNGVNIFNADMSDMTNKAVTQEVDNQSRGRTDGPTVRAYLKSIDIMKNTVNSDLQLLAIPGIRNSSVTEVAADAVRDRFDALYLMDVEQKSTRLGTDELPQDVSEGEQDLDGGLRVSVAATVSHFEERDMDNSFAAAYFPDVVVTDPGTGGNVTVPPSVVVLGAMALNDRVGHPWFAPAGVTRGALASTQRAKVSLSKANLDALYNVGINPLTPPSAGLPVTVWGQKTLQAGNSALNRVNVRRLLIEIRRQVRDIAQTIIFEPNRAATLARFTAAVTPRLQRIQALSGLDRFRVVIDSSTTTQQDVENNTIRGKIFVQPTKSIEYVSLDFVVSNSGAQV